MYGLVRPNRDRRTVRGLQLVVESRMSFMSMYKKEGRILTHLMTAEYS